MRIHFRILVALALLGAFAYTAPLTHAQVSTAAQAGSTRSAEQAAPAKKQKAGPFHGRLKAMDRSAGTIVMGTRTFHVTPKTKITKGGQPATMADGVIGEMVSGYFKTSEEGKLELSSLRFGPKPQVATESGTEKKSTKPSIGRNYTERQK